MQQALECAKTRVEPVTRWWPEKSMTGREPLIQFCEWRNSAPLLAGTTARLEKLLCSSKRRSDNGDPKRIPMFDSCDID